WRNHRKGEEHLAGEERRSNQDMLFTEQECAVVKGGDVVSKQAGYRKFCQCHLAGIGVETPPTAEVLEDGKNTEECQEPGQWRNGQNTPGPGLTLRIRSKESDRQKAYGKWNDQ